MQSSVEYLAGFFDGEGCISVTRDVWTVSCCQTEKNGTDALGSMQKRWGGSLSRHVPTNPNHSPVWKWSVKGLDAAIALTDMYMFLTVKLPRAKEALESMTSKPRIFRILGRIGEPEYPYYTPTVGD